MTPPPAPREDPPVVANFRYVEPGHIALSGLPVTPDEAEWLHDQGIRSVVSLEPPPPEVIETFRELGIAWHDSVLGGFGDGSPDARALATRIAAEAEERPGVLIH